MTRRLAAAAAALAIGLVAPATSALAYYDRAPVERRVPAAPFDAYGYGPVWGSHGWCAPSSAAEGNANQQTRPVKQYGQTSGGSRC